MPAPRSPLLVCVLLAASFGCGLEHIDAILAKYDTFGSTHGEDEHAILAGLPDRLRELKVDAVISGMGC